MSTHPIRKRTRLPGFDYASEGAYFVSLVTQNRECLFAEIINDEVVLSEFGKIVDFTWNDLQNHNPNFGLGAFVIKPEDTRKYCPAGQSLLVIEVV